MSKQREVLRLLSLGLSSRMIISSVHVGPQTITEIRKLCADRGLSYEEALKLDDDELFAKKKKTTFKSDVGRPDCSYIHEELKKKGVTLKLLHEEYQEECVIKGIDYLKYTQFCNVYKEYVEDNKLTMHIERKPGERIEVDWAGATIPIYDTTQKEIIAKAHLFVGVLPFSQYMYCAASLDMKSESWINHHINMFKHFNGVASILQCDNLKTGVISHKKYDEIIYNQAYKEMCEYYDTAVLATRVRRPKDKASSEGSVGYLTNQITARIRNIKATSIFELNDYISKQLKILNDSPFQKRDYSRTYVYENEEKEYLKPLPDRPYEFAIWKKATVGFNYHVSYDYNYYSVPYTYLRKTLDLRISKYMIEIFDGDKRIVSHPRIIGSKGKYVTLNEHMPPNHQQYGEWNRERIINWSKNIGSNTYRVICQIFDNSKYEVQVYNQCMSILKLKDKYSKETLESASEYILNKHITPIHRNFMIVIESIQKNNNTRKEDGAILRGPSYYGEKK